VYFYSLVAVFYGIVMCPDGKSGHSKQSIYGRRFVCYGRGRTDALLKNDVAAKSAYAP